MPLSTPFSNNLRACIKALGERHGGLRKASRETGVSYAYLKRLQNGQRKTPSSETLHKLGIQPRTFYVLLPYARHPD